MVNKINSISTDNIKNLLEEKYLLYNNPEFIENDPISIPHQYSRLQDIEIMGLFASVFAWGNRKTIISKSKQFASFMDNTPYYFILNHRPEELKRFKQFRHRTFNYEDALYFIYFLRKYYSKNKSLETAFSKGIQPSDSTIENGLNHFAFIFFNSKFAPIRTRKHISCPERKSACKRINMFLRWMVRKDNKGVDFGLWKKISSSQLVCPIDVHVEKISRKLGLLERKSIDWQAAIELTSNLRKMDPLDPVKYDFALFGLSANENGV